MTPWTAAFQAPLSMGFSRQEYWSGVPSVNSTITSLILIDLFPFFFFLAAIDNAVVSIFALVKLFMENFLKQVVG